MESTGNRFGLKELLNTDDPFEIYLEKMELERRIRSLRRLVVKKDQILEEKDRFIEELIDMIPEVEERSG